MATWYNKIAILENFFYQYRQQYFYQHFKYETIFETIQITITITNTHNNIDDNNKVYNFASNKTQYQSILLIILDNVIYKISCLYCFTISIHSNIQQYF